MLRDIWTKTIWDQRRGLLGWGIGLLAVALVYGGFYPVAAGPDYVELIDSLPEGLAEAMGWGDIATAHGYLGSTVYGLLGPVLTIILAINSGARAIAGDEESGGLELLIAHPVSRARVVLQRTVALAVVLLAAGLVVFAAIMLIRGPIDLPLSVANIAAASFQLSLLAGVFGAFALLVGGIVGRRGTVVGSAAVLAVVSYLANGVAPQVDALAWMQQGSPFHWYAATDVLEAGLQPGGTLLLAGTIAIFVAGSVVAFNRRDVGAA